MEKFQQINFSPFIWTQSWRKGYSTCLFSLQLFLTLKYSYNALVLLIVFISNEMSQKKQKLRQIYKFFWQNFPYKCVLNSQKYDSRRASKLECRLFRLFEPSPGGCLMYSFCNQQFNKASLSLVFSVAKGEDYPLKKRCALT